jgi:RNA polymerase sigma factor (sigma-70 family)
MEREMAETPRFPVEDLLAQQDWVRRLARHLAGDDPEDVAQEAAMIGLSSPAPRTSARGWLAEIVRNLVRVRFRNDLRRRARERAWAEAQEAPPTVDEAFERLALQRFVAEQVTRLDEALRTVVVLRYFEGLDSGRIAAITGVPAGTVRWRLKVALERLRAALDARNGGTRRTWAIALSPRRFTWPAAAAGLAKGAWFMAKTQKKLALVGSLLLLLLGLGVVERWRRQADPSTALDQVTRGRSPSVASRLATDLAPLKPLGDGVVSGRVEDAAGAPVEGAAVIAALIARGAGGGLALPSPFTLSGPGGAFTLSGLAPGMYRLAATKPSLGTARSPGLSIEAGRPARDVVLVLEGAAAELSGQVVDSGGGGIAGARVFARMGDDDPITFGTLTDEQGHYRLPLAPAFYSFSAEADGYATAGFSHFLHLPMVRNFRLHPGARIEGRVTARADGAPLAGASVLAILRNEEPRQRTTALDGSFSFADLEPGTYRLRARLGRLVSTHEETLVVGLAEQRTDVTLALDVGRTVSGVVNEAGVPVAGALVRVLARDAPASAWTGADGRHRDRAGLGAPERRRLGGRRDRRRLRARPRRPRDRQRRRPRAASPRGRAGAGANRRLWRWWVSRLPATGARCDGRFGCVSRGGAGCGPSDRQRDS